LEILFVSFQQLHNIHHRDTQHNIKNATLGIRQGGQKIGKTFAQVLEKVAKTVAWAKMPKYLYQSSI
jgi:hypothetical protein